MTSQDEVFVSSFLGDFFLKAQDVCARYVVLRNYDSLPERPGNDVDILVDPAHIQLLERILFEVADRNAWRLCRKEDRFAFRSYGFVHYSPSRAQVLKWDFWFPLTWKGITWAQWEYILDNSHFHRGVRIPSAGCEAAILCLKDVIQVGHIRQKYHSRIHEFALASPREFEATLQSLWSSELIQWLLEQIGHLRWEEIEGHVGYLQKDLVFNSLRIRTIKGVLQFGFGHMKQRFDWRGGYFLCLVGPDGSGKSTIAQGVEKQIGELFSEVRHYHGRFHILPELSKLLGKDPSNTEVAHANTVHAPHPTPGRLRVYIYLLYYGFDDFMGSIVLAKARRSNRLLSFDRYYYDYVLQPGFVKPQDRFFRMLTRLIPQPDRVFYLYAPAEVVHQRKPELEIQEISRQEETCFELKGLLPNFEIVDNSGRISDSIQTVVSKVLEDIETSWLS